MVQHVSILGSNSLCRCQQNASSEATSEPEPSVHVHVHVHVHVYCTVLGSPILHVRK